MPRPAKIKIVPDCIFRQNNPAILGIEVLEGVLKVGAELIKTNGDVVDEVKSMQSEGENLREAKKGEQVAISLPRVTIGRQIKGDETFYTNLTEDDFKNLKN